MKIKKSIYQGYLWCSDQKEPKVLKNEEFGLEIADDKKPFIVEGQLYDGKNSISIKYVDGKYIMKEYEVSDSAFEDPHVETKAFLPNRMNIDRKLSFLQYWRPQKDEFCENFEVLQPAELVFVGFEKGKEK